LKTGLGQDTWAMWGLKPLSEQCRSRFAENCFGNRRSCPENWIYWPNQCHALSGTVNTWERVGAWRDTYLLLLWRRSNGQEQSISSSGTPRTGMKISSSWKRNSSPSRSSTITRRTRFMLKCPMRWKKTFHHPFCVMVCWWCPIRGWQLFIFARKGWNWCPSVSRQCASRNCEIF